MRTTLTIDDNLAAELKLTAHKDGKTFKQVVNEVLRAGLQKLENPQPSNFKLQPTSLGKLLLSGVDLNKSLHLADELENEAILQKLEQRK